LLGISIAVILLVPAYTASENLIIPSKNISTSGPALQYRPRSHDFGYVEEGEYYFTNFEIWNDGNGTLTWNLICTQSWILFYPTNGSSTGAHDIVHVSIDTTGLSPGMHTASIVINSNDTTSINSFDVSFFINEPPNTPSRPNGPSEGEVGTYYSYSTSTTDPEGDQIRYGIDVQYDGIIDHWSDMYYPSGATYTLRIKFLSAGTYHLRFKAKDEHGAQSGFSPIKTVVINGDNHAPTAPTTPIGPSTGDIDTSYSFSTSSTDSDGDKIKYGWDWDGDNVIDEWTGFYDSGTIVSLSHLYSDSGSYNIKVVAEDEHGAQSGFSPSKTIVITGNNPPNKPATPTGPTSGRIGITFSYSSTTIDPDGDNIYYLFDWGDGTNSGWIGPYNSGSGITESHAWASRGSFPIKVKAKDDPNGDGDLSDGTESVWSDALPVAMPKSKNLINFNHRFFELYQTILDIIQSIK
jgi:hypothetical protein